MNISVIIDLAVILIILVSAGVAFFRGFVREVLTIFGVIGGFLAALFFGGQLTPLFRNWFGVVEGEETEKLFNLIPYSIVADVCAYASIFIAIFLILQLLSYFLSASVRAVGLGPVDRSLGVVFGIARGILLLGILYLPFHLILPEDSKREWFGEAKTFVYIESVTQWLQSFLPEDSGDEIRDTAADVGDKAKEAGDAARDKIMGLDVLDKDKDAGAEPETKSDTGYDNKARQNLDHLIEDETIRSASPPGNNAND